MDTPIVEYGASDTPSGFLRWSRPAPEKPSRTLQDILTSVKKKSWYHLAMWALLSGVTLACGLWYIGALLTISYNLPSLLDISVEKLTLERCVWCGMVTLDSRMEYCARGMIDLKIHNRMWTEITILSGSSFLGYTKSSHFAARTAPRASWKITEGFLAIAGTVVEPTSEDLHVLPVYLSSTTPIVLPSSNLTIESVVLEIYALGYYFGYLRGYGRLKVPDLALECVLYCNGTSKMSASPVSGY